MVKRFFMSHPYLDGGEEEANGYYLAYEVDQVIKKLVIENRKLRDLLSSIKIHCEQVDKM